MADYPPSWEITPNCLVKYSHYYFYKYISAEIFSLVDIILDTFSNSIVFKGKNLKLSREKGLKFNEALILQDTLHAKNTVIFIL